MTRVGSIFVPYEGPADSTIALVGEAPGLDEEREKRPFIGEAGNMLVTCLGRNGIPRENVRLLNLSHHRPERNKFEMLLGTAQLEAGLDDLYDTLRVHKPTVIGALGNWPMYYLTGKRGKKPGSGITNWRGSILSCSIPGLEDVKVIPTFHPANIARERSKYPIFDMDIKRIVSDSAFPELRHPQREFIIAPQGAQIEECVRRLLDAKRLAVDIETYGMEIACIGFAPSANEAVCFAYDPNDLFLREVIQGILSSGIPLTFHFGTYDTLVLEHHGYSIANYAWDTLVAQHALWPELPRALQFLTSVNSRQPYYKHMRKEEAGDIKSWNKKVKRELLYTYNCIDCCETALAEDVQRGDMTPAARRTFEFEMSLIEPAKRISRAGMLVDDERRKLIKAAAIAKWIEAQDALDKVCGGHVNPRSPKQVIELLYSILKLPPRIDHKTHKPTVDGDAIVSLIAFTKDKINSLVQKQAILDWRRKHLILKLILILRGTLKLLSSYIDPARSEDGRWRSTVKVAGPETGRWSMEKFIDKTGLNAQTFPRDPIEIPDKIFELIKDGKLEELLLAYDEAA